MFINIRFLSFPISYYPTRIDWKNNYYLSSIDFDRVGFYFEKVISKSNSSPIRNVFVVSRIKKKRIQTIPT